MTNAIPKPEEIHIFCKKEHVSFHTVETVKGEKFKFPRL
jgi:hypothetical protein